jgi:hypothetical protein
MHDLRIFYRNGMVRHREQILGAIHFGMMKKRNFDGDQKDHISSVKPRLTESSPQRRERSCRAGLGEASARPERKSEPVFGPVHPSSAAISSVRVTHLYSFGGHSMRSATHSIVQNDIEQ